MEEIIKKHMLSEERRKQIEVVDNIINSDVDSVRSTELSRTIDPNELQEFKQQVKTWLELDLVVKRLQAAIKERKKIQKELRENILKFMLLNNVEDLNTKHGTIRYRTSLVKAPLGQKEIKEKLYSEFEGEEQIINKIKRVFDDREKRERTTLTKLKF